MNKVLLPALLELMMTHPSFENQLQMGVISQTERPVVCSDDK